MIVINLLLCYRRIHAIGLGIQIVYSSLLLSYSCDADSLPSILNIMSVINSTSENTDRVLKNYKLCLSWVDGTYENSKENQVH